MAGDVAGRDTDLVFVGGSAGGGAVAAYAPAGDSARRWIAVTDGGVRALALHQGILYVGGLLPELLPGRHRHPEPAAVLHSRRRGAVCSALNTSTPP